MVLRFDVPLPSGLAAGTQILFQGVATEFTLQPFMVTFEAGRFKIDRVMRVGFPGLDRKSFGDPN